MKPRNLEGTPVIAALFADLAAAARGVARHKAGTAVLILGIGVSAGAGAVVFTALHALLFAAPPGVTHASRLVTIHTSQFSGATHGPSSLPDLRAIETDATTVEAVAAEDDSEVNVRFGPHQRAVRVASVSSSYFNVLGLRPAAGELPARDTAWSDAAVMPPAAVSASLWRDVGGGVEAIGQTLTLGGREHVVVAVLPSGFQGLQFGRAVRVWVPLPDDASARGRRTLAAIARLRRGAAVADAQSELAALGVRFADEHPETNRGSARSAVEPRRFTVLPYQRLPPAQWGRGMLLALIAVGATLLILGSACVNTAGILLNRATARRREIAVKLALGAERGRLARQLAFESALLVVAGGAAGLLLAHATRYVVPALLTPEIAEMLPSAPDIGVTAGMLLVCALAGLVFGTVPASLVSRTNPAAALQHSDALMSTPGTRGFRTAVVVAQIAFATVFLLAAASAREAFDRALVSDFGMRNRHLLVASVQTSVGESASRNDAWYDELAGALKARGIGSTAWVTSLPLERGVQRRFALALDAGGRTITEQVDADVVGASREFFRVSRMYMMEGRPFDNASGGPVTRVVVNDVFASRYLGGRAAGHRLEDPGGESLEIAGVVRGGHYRTLQEAARPMVYYPLAELPSSRLYFIVAPERAPPGVEWHVREALEARALGVTRIARLDEMFSERLVLDRSLAWLVSLAGALSLLLALIGVHSVLAELVLRQTREIGLRMALGAPPASVAGMVLGGTARLTAAGLFAGVFAAFILSRLAATLVFGVPSATGGAIGAAAGLIALVVLAAAVGPLRRALGISPSIALRAQ